MLMVIVSFAASHCWNHGTFWVLRVALDLSLAIEHKQLCEFLVLNAKNDALVAHG